MLLIIIWLELEYGLAKLFLVNGLKLNLVAQFLRSNCEAEKVRFWGIKKQDLPDYFFKFIRRNIDDLVMRDAQSVIYLIIVNL